MRKELIGTNLRLDRGERPNLSFSTQSVDQSPTVKGWYSQLPCLTFSI